jgi:hypothetical protein
MTTVNFNMSRLEPARVKNATKWSDPFVAFIAVAAEAALADTLWVTPKKEP